MNRAPYLLVWRGFLVVLPLIAVLIGTEVILQISGEVLPIAEVAHRNQPGSTPGLYMRMFIDQQTYRYRYEQIKLLRPRVLTLGSSRVQRFRQEMFGPDAGFYNSAGIAAGVGDLEAFVSLLPADYAPEALIIGVDSWWFNRRISDTAIGGAGLAEDIYQDDAQSASGRLYAYQQIVRSVVNRRLSPAFLGAVARQEDAGVHRYGFGAWSGRGFANDGSSQSLVRETPSTYQDRETPPVVQRVREGIWQFTPTPSVDSDRLERFEKVLLSLSQRGTQIIGFAPPFSSEVRHAIQADAVQAAFYRDFQDQIAVLFQRNGWYFLDATVPEAFGLDDHAMEDGFHAMETFHVALLAAMAEDTTVRLALDLNPDYLESLWKDAATTPWYPNYTPTNWAYRPR